VKAVCEYLNSIDPHIEVKYNSIQNASKESVNENGFVNFIVLQVSVTMCCD